MKRNLYRLAALCVFAAVSCTPENPVPSVDYRVDRLISPRNNIGVNVYNITSVLRFEWEAKEVEADETFVLVFDRLGGDFETPLYERQVSENFCEFSREEAKELYGALEPEDGVAVASWSVSACSSQGRRICSDSRNIILSKEADPALVEYLYAPIDNYVVNLARIKTGLEFKWARAVYNGDEELSYELVFYTDSPKSPVAVYESQDVSLTLERDELMRILDILDPENEPKNGTVRWTVNTVAEGRTWRSAASCSLVLTDDISKAFTPGVPVYIGGEGAEHGRQMSYINEGHYNTGEIYQDKLKSCDEGDWGYYEIFTALKAGRDYWFYTMSDAQTVDCYIKGDELKIVETEAEARVRADMDGIYRIRINTVNGKTGLALVSKVVICRAWDKKTTELEYAGNGIWTAKDFNVDWQIDANIKDERFRFIMTVSSLDGSQTYEQGWSQQIRQDGRPTKDSPASYWYMKPTNLSQWDNVWKYPAWLLDDGNTRLWSCDVNFIANSDDAYYTHEFVNEYIWGRTEDFREGYDLKIGGSGAEQGQPFCYLANAAWYNTASGWNDMVNRIDTDYYEIYTELKSGSCYFYCDSNPDKKWYFNPETMQQASNASAAGVNVPEPGIYRIRIDYANAKVSLDRIGAVYLNNAWGDMGKGNASLSYAGFGIWKAEQLRITLHDFNDPSRADPYDTRYKFCMEIADRTQGLGKVRDDIMYVQLTGGGNWDERFFDFPSYLTDKKHRDRFNADVFLYMTSEKGQYSHEFKNVTDNYPGAFNSGDDLYIDGEGSAEKDQKLSYITENEWNPNVHEAAGQVSAFASQNYDYEIFTRLSAGRPFVFRTEDSKALFGISEDGNELVELDDASKAAFSVSSDGIYRVRFSTVDRKAYVAAVSKAYLWSCGENKAFEMSYDRRGSWKIAGHKPVITQGWNDERYMFRFVIAGVEQPYGRQHTMGTRPSDNTEASYYYVQPTKVNQWDPGFKWNNTIFDAAMANGKTYPGTVTVYLNMNKDHGHYNHEVIIN